MQSINFLSITIILIKFFPCYSEVIPLDDFIIFLPYQESTKFISISRFLPYRLLLN